MIKTLFYVNAFFKHKDLEKENQKSQEIIKELANKMKSEKIKNMELNSNLKSLGEELNIKTVALDAAKSDSLKLAGSLTNLKFIKQMYYFNSLIKYRKLCKVT